MSNDGSPLLMVEQTLESVRIITWNLPDSPVNVINVASIRAFEAAARRAIEDDQIKGVVIASGKADFIVGADLAYLAGLAGTQDILDFVGPIQGLFREIEKCGKPFVAAINGSALGGGLELALACHRRVVGARPQARLGLPEVTIGLIPGAGGTQRLPRMIGIEQALPLLLEGRHLDPAAARAAGIVDETVEPERLIAHCCDWIRAAAPADSARAWDRQTYRFVELPMPENLAKLFAGQATKLQAKYNGNLPAQQNLLSAVYEGALVDFDQALRIETRHFVNTARTVAARNMIRTLFFSINEANKLADRPKAVPSRKFDKVGILGAGMMGAGLAYVCSAAGQRTVLLDRDVASAEKGKATAGSVLRRKMEAGQIGSDQASEQLALIEPSESYETLAGCDLVIEAVFEDRAVKAEVTRRAEEVTDGATIFASNTSTLPISGLAKASRRPEAFIGLHFFSPVDRMALVEVIRGRATSETTLAHALDFVKSIKKTPIIVNDNRGFYTSRVFLTYVSEGIAMLREGVPPALIENGGKMAGMPVGPLAQADEVSLSLLLSLRQQARQDLGAAYVADSVDEVLSIMVETLGRAGRKVGCGFYDYHDNGSKQLWPDLERQIAAKPARMELREAQDRLMYIQSLEAARCIDEGVISNPRDADIGAVLGWGFPAFLGGPIGQIDTVGPAQFVDACERLADKFGSRFTPGDFAMSRNAKLRTTRNG